MTREKNNSIHQEILTPERSINLGTAEAAVGTLVDRERGGGTI
jgi:hypothetical protein